MLRSSARLRRRRPLGWSCLLGPAIALFLTAAPADAASFKVGSFTKATGAAPAVQAVPHGLGEVPKALILWTVGRTNQSFGPGLRAGFGFTDNQTGASDSHSQGWSINDGVTPSNADTHSSTGFDPERVLVIQSPTGPVASADFGGWDATNFTLNWLTNDANPYVIHFIAIGGAEVRAEMVSTNLHTTTGNRGIGMNFKPDVVFLLPTQSQNTGVNTSAAAPSLGAVDRHGNQWAVAGWSGDGRNPSDTLRFQATDAAILNFDATGTLTHRAAFAGFLTGPPDGIDLNYSVGTPCGGTNCRLFVLGIAGIEAWVGSFTKATIAGPQTVTGIPRMKPRAIFLASNQDVAQAGPVDHHRMGIGASDGTTQAASAWQDTDNQNPSSADSIDKTSKVFVKFDNATPSIDAEADLTSLDWGGFTLNWTTNDAVPTEMLYVALGEDTTNYRSIGTAGAYGAGVGTVAVTHASRTVTGTGTAWQANNRGRGDVITIPCLDPPTCTGGIDYPVLGASDTIVVLSRAYAGATASGLSYLVRRQFSNLAAWEDCVDGQGGSPPPAAPCFYFPAPTSSLVADDRAEVGIAYDDASPSFTLSANVVFDGSTTDATHGITLTADGGNRHNGTAGTGVVIDANLGTSHVNILDGNVTLEWLELKGLRGADNSAMIRAVDSGTTNILLQNLLIHDYHDPTTVPTVIDQGAIRLSGSAGKSVTVRNVMIWDGDNEGIRGDEVGDTLIIENCSLDDIRDSSGNPQRGVFADNQTGVIVRNTIVTRSGTDYDAASGSFDPAASANNIDSDGTAPGASPQTVLASDVFVVPGTDLHLKAGANPAVDVGVDLSASFTNDIDGGLRPNGAAWDIGADEFGATTAVELVSFDALPGDAAVGLEWRTGSELDNLGFHLHRSLSESGPWTRITPSLIPGLGSSPEGASYSFRDSGLTNGVRHFYRLEDIDTSSVSTFHGPVSATPSSSAPAEDDDGDVGAPESEDDPDSSTSETAYGAPASRPSGSSPGLDARLSSSSPHRALSPPRPPRASGSPSPALMPAATAAPPLCL